MDVPFDTPKKTNEGVALSPDVADIFQTNFVYMLLGKPGSGKSFLLNQLITKDHFYGKKFDRIIYITPTPIYGVIND